MVALAEFIHLRVHTAYSLAEGAIRPDALSELCLEHKMPAVGITDSGNLFGSLECSLKCAAAGIQPVIGCVLPFRNPDQDSPSAESEQLVCLAQNEEGYGNLLKLVSQAYMTPAAGAAPLLDYEALEAHAEGVILLTGGPKGRLARLIAGGQTDEAKKFLRQLAGWFPGNMYIELMRHGLPEETASEQGLIDLALAHHIPLVATNDVYFDSAEMYEAHDALLCIAGGNYVTEEERRRVTPEHYFKSPEEMCELFSDIPEAIQNTRIIAQRCAYMSPERAPILPSFPLEQGDDEAEELRIQSRQGLEKRLEKHVFEEGMTDQERQEVAKPYFERLDFELNIIINMNFPGYFLIVSDFIRWSKRHGIPVGPGRGSGAGSLVAWSLEITDLDPLRFGLLFERFLNPERVSMPDFDVDFCQERRDEVIRYVQQKYGGDKVAQIITFGKLQARAVLRDVGRVLQLPYGQVDKICKLVPNNPANPVTLQEAIDMEPALKEAMRSEEAVQKMVDVALKLEGLYRHASTHAAGVVIADRPLDELVPLYRDPRSDMPVVQYSMKYAEKAGLVKFDFLGLKTLTVIARACKLLKDRGIELDMYNLPLNDPVTYEMMARGETTGVFQLESSGMRDVLRKLRPDKIEDIIALVSLYRPGPMDNIPTYISRKHGLETVEYPHPLLEPILEETYGVIIYQEQVMQIAQVLAGYSLGGADLLRRAMGKKIQAEMDAQRSIFVKGAVENGVDEKKADYIFDLVNKFAGYGFNKSHAAAYAFIAYQTAYLKANYPVEFFAASMTYDMHNTDKLAHFVQEAQKSGIAVLPPDVNASGAQFTVEESSESGVQSSDEENTESGIPNPELCIRYALGALKNVGVEAMRSVESEREQEGTFKDLFDFAGRLDAKVMNKRQLENLARAGAFEGLNSNRRQVMESVDVLTAYAHRMAEDRASNQESLFGEAGLGEAQHPALMEVEDWPVDERLQQEFEAVGFFLSGHPLDRHQEQLKKRGVTFSTELDKKLSREATAVRVAGIVTGKRMMVSPKGRFAFVQMSDPLGEFEISIFDESLLNQTRDADLLENGARLFVKADGRREEEQLRLIATGIEPLDGSAPAASFPEIIRIDNAEALAQWKAKLEAAKLPSSQSITLIISISEEEEAVVRIRA